MEIVYDVLVVLHLLGMAGILSGVLMRVTAPEGPSGKMLLHSASLQVVTGLALAGIASAGLVDADPSHVKIAVKLVVAVLVLVLSLVLYRKPDVGRGVFPTLAVLTVANVCVAVFW